MSIVYSSAKPFNFPDPPVGDWGKDTTCLGIIVSFLVISQKGTGLFSWEYQVKTWVLAMKTDEMDDPFPDGKFLPATCGNDKNCFTDLRTECAVILRN